MKKVLALTLVAVLLAGCGAASVKTGLGNTISIDSSKDATADEEGLAQVDTTMAAVTVDSAGKILGVKIDTAQVKVNFDQTGKIITTDKAVELKTKVERGNDYNMKKASSIGKEWFEQIAELEKWMVGKTANDISGLAVTKNKEGGSVPSDPDLSSKVTLSVDDYQAAVTEAIANAK
mgnify:CR=1 FL=1